MAQSLEDRPPDRPKIELSKLRIQRGESDPDRGRPWGTIALATVLVFLAGAGFIGYRFYSGSASVPEIEVAHATIESPDASFEVLSATGYVVAHRTAAVSPKISGKVEYVGVDVGAYVKEGQVLARLEHHDIDAEIQDARAAEATAEANKAAAQAAEAQSVATIAQAKATEYQSKLDLQRQTKLLSDGVASQSDFDNADAKEKVSLAQLRAAEAQQHSAVAQINSWSSQISSAAAKIQQLATQVEYTNIRAPFNGLVISKDAEIGESVAPAIFGGGTTRGSIVTIIDPKTLEVEADVNESNITKVEEGLPAEITLDAIPGQKFPGEAYQIVPTADRQKATVKVKVRFTRLDPRILPDMTAKVTFLSKAPEEGESAKASSKITVPRAALLQRDSGQSVFIVDGDRVKLQAVKVGSDMGDRVEILQGLVGGETVVLHPADGLKDGARIKVKTD